MALDLGTLTGYLNLDSDGFERTLDQMPGKLESSGKGMKLVAGGLALAVGLAIAGGIAQAMDLQAAEAKLEASLGLSAKEAQRLGGVAGKLYADAYGESVEEVGDAVATVVSSIEGMGTATDEVLTSMTEKALNFATVFEIDVARSTQVVGQLIKGGLVADANEGFDLLTRTMQKVPKAVREDIMDAADEYGPFFAGLGLKGAKAFDLLVRASEKGMYGIDKAGDALKEFTIRSTDMSTTSVAAYEAVGLDAGEMAAKILAGGDVAAAGFDQIIDGLLGIEDPVARANAAIGLFGTPLEDLGVQEIPAFLASLDDLGGGMDDVSGAADRMGEAVNDTAEVHWTTLQRKWEAIIGQVGQDLLPVLEDVIGWLEDNPDAVTGFATAIGVLAAAFVVLKGVQGIAGVYGMLDGVLTKMKALETQAPKTSTVVAGALGGVVATLPGVVDGEVSGGDVVTGLGSSIALGAMTDSPVAVAVAAVTSLITSMIADMMDDNYGVWNMGWEQLTGMVPGAPQELYNWLGSTDGTIAGWWEGTQNKFELGWEQITGQAPGAPLEFYSWLGDRDKDVDDWWGGLMGKFALGYEQIKGFFNGAGDWLYQSGKDVVNGFIEGAKSMFVNIGRIFLNTLPEWIRTPFMSALGIHSPSTVFAGYGRNIVQGLIVGVSGEAATLDATMSGLVSAPRGLPGFGSPGGAYGAPASAQALIQVSLAGARIALDVGGEQIVGVIREQVLTASDDRQSELVNGVREGVVYA